MLSHKRFGGKQYLLILVLCDASNDYWCFFFKYVVSILSITELCLMVMFMWCIWGARNNILFRGQSSGAQNICARAQGILDSFQSLDINSVKCNLSSERQENVKWEPPPVDWLKLNVDAAVDAKRVLWVIGLLCEIMMAW